MPAHSTQIKRSAEKDLLRIAHNKRGKIIYVGSALKGQLRGRRRIRVGDYRVVYEIQDVKLVVLVVGVAHRRDIYRH